MARGWYRDGVRMARDESEKTEKITINLGLVDLGQIDLLVQEGFYANRTEFIRTAIRTQLDARGEALDQTADRRTLTLGSCHYTRRDLEEIRDAGQMIHIRVLGLASIDADVSPQLALTTIASVEVLGAFRAPAAVKGALAARTAAACVTVIATAARTAGPAVYEPSCRQPSKDDQQKGHRHERTPDGG